MKKIFRMALVFALAGATLMYTGCSKDYSEDINRLDQDVSALGSELGTKYQDLLNQLSSAKTSLEAAYKAADKELSDGFNTKINAIQNDINGINAALAKKADKADVDAAISQLQKDVEAELAELRSELEAAAEELEKTADGLKKEVQEKLDEFYAKISNELRSLVFVPDFYYEGIEATAYSQADFQVYKLTALTDADEDGFQKGAKTGTIDYAVSKLQDKDPNYKYVIQGFGSNRIYRYHYDKGEEAVATFDLNPSSFDIAGAEWSLAGMTRENVKAEEEETWEPAFVKASKNEDGKLEVTYSISNPDLMHTRGYWDGQREDLNLIQLSAKVGDKTIASDWAAVVPNVESNVQLQFADATKHGNLQTTATLAKSLSEGNIRDWAYNSGALDLAKVIEIKVNDASTYSIEEFQTKYPGFEYQFELVPYTDGTNNTREDKYGVIERTEFTPCYVDAAGNSYTIAKGATEGSSAIGRKPIVLVTLNEPNGNVVAHGFFKIEIAREAPSVTEIAIKDFGKLPFLCSTALTTKWSEFSASVLEALHTDYAQFHNDFEIDGTTTNNPGYSEWNAQLYVKDGDKYIIAEEGNSRISFGTMTFTKDASGNGVNDTFTWTFNKGQAENIDKYQNLYVLFESDYNSVVAMKFSADIAEPLEITYGEINPSYWFNDVEAGVDNTVRANVKVPTTAAENLTSFEKDLDDYFIGNEVKIKLDPSSDEVYAPYFDGTDNPDDLGTYYEYMFSSQQPTINGIQLFTNEYSWYGGMTGYNNDYNFGNAERNTILYAGQYANGKLQTTTITVNGEEIKVAKYNEAYKVAEIAKRDDNKGTVKYYKPTGDGAHATWKASELLNLWGASETDAAKMLYANVDIIYAATQSACEVARDSSTFHVRFLRPLSIVHKAKADTLKDAVVGGATIYLGDLLNVKDWNSNGAKSMWEWRSNTVNGKNNELAPEGDGFYPTYASGASSTDYIVWGKYYGIQGVTVKNAEILTDQNGDWKKLTSVSSTTKAYVARLSDNGWEKENDEISLAFNTCNHNTKINNLSEYTFVYMNNEGSVKDFKLRIPVSVRYSWGSVDDEVIVYVKATAAK